jgi:hypothetical protein
MRFQLRLVVYACAAAAMGATEASAQCPDSLLWATPQSEALIAADGHIVVRGMGSFGRQVATLAGRSPSLEGDGDHVPLVVLSVHTTGDALQSEIVEAVLVPIRPLRAGKWYRLALDHRDPSWGSAWKRMAWFVSPGIVLPAEKVTSRIDGPVDCTGPLSETMAAFETEYIRLPPRQGATYSMGHRVLAVVLFHVGVAVAAAAWVHARGRRGPKENER